MLERQDVDAFRRDGFVRVSAFLDAAATRALARLADELAGSPEVPGGVWRYWDESARGPGGERLLHRLERFAGKHPDARALLGDARLLAALAQLFGEPAVLFKEKINWKPPGGSGFEPHQDMQAGWSRYAPRFLNVLVAIDAADLANGCLEVAAGEHERGLLGPEWAPLSDDVCAQLRFVPVPLAPGDALFFDANAPHRSAPNRTAAARRLLYATYSPASSGDQSARYWADKRASYPPDVERTPGVDYRYRV